MSLVGSGADAAGRLLSGAVSAGEKLVPLPWKPCRPAGPVRKAPLPALRVTMGAPFSNGRQPAKLALRRSVCSTSIARRPFSLIRVVDEPTACRVRVLTKIVSATTTTNSPTAMPTISSTSVMPRAPRRPRLDDTARIMVGRS